MTRVATSRILPLLLAVLLLAGGLAADEAAPAAPPAAGDQPPTTAEVGGEAAPADATDNPTDDADADATATPPTVAYVKLTGPIEDLQHDYMKRALETAKQRGADLVVVHIDSPGGTVLHSELISKLLLVDRPKMVAWVDDKAWSGGALAAYSCEDIYLAPTAKIGDIGVVTVGPDGSLKRPEVGDKVESPMRAHFKVILSRRDWPVALFMKMTDWDRPVYRAVFPDGRTEYVIDRDGALQEFLREHPEIAEYQDDRLELVYQEGELLSLAAPEAVKLGMATGLADDLEGLYALLGVQRRDVIDLAPTAAELTARDLRPWASVLLGLAVLFIIFEVKTPGVGIWVVLAACCGVGFVISQYYLHFTNHFEVVLLVVGLALLAVDLWFGLTGGALAILGGVLFLAAALAAFMPDSSGWDWSAPGWGDAFGRALSYTGITVIIMLVGLGVFLVSLPHLTWIKRLSITGVSGGPSAAPAPAAAGGPAGTILVTASELHPGGTVLVDGVQRSARSEYGDYLPAGARVVVVDQRLGELVVRPAAEPPGGSAPPGDDPAGEGAPA